MMCPNETRANLPQRRPTRAAFAPMIDYEAGFWSLPEKLRGTTWAAASLILIALAGCTSSQPRPSPSTSPTPPASASLSIPPTHGLGDIVEIYAAPWPEGPNPVVAEPGAPMGHGKVPLESVLSLVPQPFPENPTQTCENRAIVEFTFRDGSSLRYGPCALPPSMESLRLKLLKLGYPG
jgi:hypothetical protein